MARQFTAIGNDGAFSQQDQRHHFRYIHRELTTLDRPTTTTLFADVAEVSRLTMRLTFQTYSLVRIHANLTFLVNSYATGVKILAGLQERDGVNALVLSVQSLTFQKLSQFDHHSQILAGSRAQFEALQGFSSFEHRSRSPHNLHQYEPRPNGASSLITFPHGRFCRREAKINETTCLAVEI